MGQDKSLLTYRNKRMIDSIYDLMLLVADPIYVSCNRENPLLKDVLHIKDLIPNSGPLSGLHAVMTQTNSSHYLILPTDTPLIDMEILQQLHENYDGAEIIYAKTSDGIHPLIGIFPRTSLRSIEECLKNGELRITDLFTKFPSKALNFDDRYKKKFTNINRPEDLTDDRN